MRNYSKKPEFLRGNSPLRMDMFMCEVTFVDLQERIKKECGYNVPASTISIILDEKLCDFVKKTAREMCDEVSKNIESRVS